VDTASVTADTSIGGFYAPNRTHGIGIGYQDVRQIVAGQPLKLNAGTTGKVYLGDVSSGGVSLVMAGGSVGIGLDNRTELCQDRRWRYDVDAPGRKAGGVAPS
jgi:hypothetical protein